MLDKFGVKEYISLLKLFKKNGYDTRGFNQKLNKKKLLILRHDIDFSPDMALKFAKIEYDLDIKATYFFLVSSEFYNIFSQSTLNVLKNIIAFGHDIGLHFDASLYKKKDIGHFCNYEAEILEKACNKPVKIVSFHRPIKNLLNYNKKIGKFKHTYMREYFEDIFYCSDSEGKWRYKKPRDLIKDNAKAEKFHMQLLIHPIWWITPSNLSPEKKIDHFVKNKNKNMIRTLEKNSKPFKNRNKKL